MRCFRFAVHPSAELRHLTVLLASGFVASRVALLDVARVF